MHPNPHPDGDDGLNAFRGIFHALLLLAPLWLICAYLIWQAQS